MGQLTVKLVCRRRYLFEGVVVDIVGKQSNTSVEGLQRPLYVCDGLRYYDIPVRIHVPRDSIVAYMHEQCRTGENRLVRNHLI